MALTVIIRSGGDDSLANLSITLDAPMIVLGRAEGCDVRLPDLSVNHRHASVRQRGREYTLTDEGSANGTHVGGMKLGAQAPHVLRAGELVRLGRVWLEFRFDVPLASKDAAQISKEMALELVRRALQAQGEVEAGARLISLGACTPLDGLQFEQPGRVYALGNAEDCDAKLPLEGPTQKCVRVVRRGEVLLLRPLSSVPVTVGDVSLAHGRDHPLRVGEVVAVGALELTFVYPALLALREMEGEAVEKMRADEPLLPPTRTKEQRISHAASPTTQSRSEGAPRAPMQAARVQVWGRTDWLVVLFATGVMVASIAGLFWLLH